MFLVLSSVSVWELAKITVEISSHLFEKYDGFYAFDVMFVRDDFLLNEFDDLMACFGELPFDFASVAIKAIDN